MSKKAFFIIGSIGALFWLYGKTAIAALKLKFNPVKASIVGFTTDILSLKILVEITNPTIFNVFVYDFDLDIFFNDEHIAVVHQPINVELKKEWVQPVNIILDVEYENTLSALWAQLLTGSISNWLLRIKGTVRADNVTVPLNLKFTIDDFLPENMRRVPAAKQTEFSEIPVKQITPRMTLEDAIKKY